MSKDAKPRRIRTYTPAEVAARLERSESSVRRHLVHLDDWRARGAWKTGEVPFVALGAEYRIPGWWLDRLVPVSTARTTSGTALSMTSRARLMLGVDTFSAHAA